MNDTHADGDYEPRTKGGLCHTEACRSLDCPCFVSGEHDPTGADHLAEMMIHAERADAAEALLISLASHDDQPPLPTPEWLRMFVLFVRLNPWLPADHEVIERVFHAYLAHTNGSSAP